MVHSIVLHGPEGTTDGEVSSGNVLGRLAFASNDPDGSYGKAVTAKIEAKAEEAFDADDNQTKLVFLLAGQADSGVATEKMSLSSTGLLTLAGGITVSGGTIAGTISTATQNSITTMTGLVTVGTIGTGVWQGTAIAGGYIANDAIDSQHYADGSVDFAHIQDVAANSILGRNANSSGVLSEIALATTQILIGDGTGFTAAALSGDVTMANDGAVTIADDVISSAELADACTAVTSFTAPLIEGSTSIQTPLIEYTDGDDAMTINDGGSVTFSAATIPAVVVGGTSGAVTLNSSTSNYFTITTSGNITDLIISNAVAGQRILVRIINGGSHTIAWTTDTIKWPGGTAPTLTTSSGTDVYGFINTGTNAFDGFIVGQALAAP